MAKKVYKRKYIPTWEGIIERLYLKDKLNDNRLKSCKNKSLISEDVEQTIKMKKISITKKKGE